MAKLHLKGHKEPIEITNEQADVLAEMITTGQHSDPFSIGGIAGTIGQIRLVERDNPEVRDRSMEMNMEAWVAERSRFRSLTPEQKAEEVLRGQALLILFIAQSPALRRTEGSWTVDPMVKDQIKRDLVEWFSDPANRTRYLADGKLFLRHLPEGHAVGKRSDRFAVRVADHLGTTMAVERAFAHKVAGVRVEVVEPQPNPTDLPF